MDYSKEILNAINKTTTSCLIVMYYLIQDELKRRGVIV